MIKWILGIQLVLFFAIHPVSVHAAPRLSVDEPVWNLGIIVDKLRFEKTVIVENVGDEPLLIGKIEESCGGFYVSMEGGPRLLPGEQARLKLTVSTFNQSGDLRAEAFVHSDDPDQPWVSIVALGQVVPKEHALGELAQKVHDLGVVTPGDLLPFSVLVRNVGNMPLTIKKMELPAGIVVISSPSAIAPGEEGELWFEYLPERPGPIEDRLTITTNDTLNRTLTFQIKGYVSRHAVSEHALIIQPVGKIVDYEPQRRVFPYRFTVYNQGAQEVEILKLESSLPLTGKRFPERIAPGQSAEGEVLIAPRTGQTPAKGFVYFLLAVPVEVR